MVKSISLAEVAVFAYVSYKYNYALFDQSLYDLKVLYTKIDCSRKLSFEFDVIGFSLKLVFFFKIRFTNAQLDFSFVGTFLVCFHKKYKKEY